MQIEQVANIQIVAHGNKWAVLFNGRFSSLHPNQGAAEKEVARIKRVAIRKIEAAEQAHHDFERSRGRDSF